MFTFSTHINFLMCWPQIISYYTLISANILELKVVNCQSGPSRDFPVARNGYHGSISDWSPLEVPLHMWWRCPCKLTMQFSTFAQCHCHPIWLTCYSYWFYTMTRLKIYKPYKTHILDQHKYDWFLKKFVLFAYNTENQKLPYNFFIAHVKFFIGRFTHKSNCMLVVL